MSDLTKLTQWILDKIEKEYKEDIDLLVAVEGHSTDGDGHGECFDYFVPATERGYRLSRTFIIDGVGHDLYPRPWKRIEDGAGLNDFPTMCLADAGILYARTPQVRERFLALKDQLFENLKNPKYTYRKALERLDEAMDIYRTLMFEEKKYKARMADTYIALHLTQAVALMNESFADCAIFTEEQAMNQDTDSRMYHCPELAHVPENFYLYGKELLRVETAEEMKHLAYLMIESTRRYLYASRPVAVEEKKQINYHGLADWYQELSLTWRRIRYYCDRGMVEEAFMDASNLQSELIIVAEEFGFEEPDLLGFFDRNRLDVLKARSVELEKNVRDIITSHGEEIREYATLEEFLARN